MLIIALAIVAALFVAGLQGSGQTAGAASHTPVVQVTPEDAHWYDRNALVETASGRLVVAYSGHLREGDCCLYSKTSDDGGNTWSAPLFVGDGNAGGLAGCGKTLLSTQGRKLSDDKRRPIACSERIIRIGLSHAECRRDS